MKAMAGRLLEKHGSMPTGVGITDSDGARWSVQPQDLEGQSMLVLSHWEDRFVLSPAEAAHLFQRDVTLRYGDLARSGFRVEGRGTGPDVEWPERRARRRQGRWEVAIQGEQDRTLIWRVTPQMQQLLDDGYALHLKAQEVMYGFSFFEESDVVGWYDELDNRSMVPAIFPTIEAAAASKNPRADEDLLLPVIYHPRAGELVVEPGTENERAFCQVDGVWRAQREGLGVRL